MIRSTDKASVSRLSGAPHQESEHNPGTSNRMLS
jgi:hypothetical protein